MGFDNRFDNMEEIEEIIKWAEMRFPKSFVDDLKFLLGVYPNEGLSKLVEIEGKKVPIDLSIAEGIYCLNQVGCRSLACCSGLVGEHQGAKYLHSSGYLSLLYDEAILSALEQATDALGVTVKEGEAYLKRSVHITLNGETDAEIQRKWQALFCFLIEQRRGEKDGPAAIE